MVEDAKAAKQRRLAEALRVNLKRRKAAVQAGSAKAVREPPRIEPPAADQGKD